MTHPPLYAWTPVDSGPIQIRVSTGRHVRGEWRPWRGEPRWAFRVPSAEGGELRFMESGFRFKSRDAAIRAGRQVLGTVRKYQCFLQYDPQPAETGVRPFVQVHAENAEAAARAALSSSGADAVVDVVRIEDDQ